MAKQRSMGKIVVQQLCSVVTDSDHEVLYWDTIEDQPEHETTADAKGWIGDQVADGKIAPGRFRVIREVEEFEIKLQQRAIFG